MDEQATVDRLRQELSALYDARAPAPFTFALEAFDAYTLVAVLQFASRNPQLSDVQRDVVVRTAGLVSDALIASARARFGPASTIEETLTAGFDPAFDAPRSRTKRRR